MKGQIFYKQNDGMELVHVRGGVHTNEQNPQLQKTNLTVSSPAAISRECNAHYIMLY